MHLAARGLYDDPFPVKYKDIKTMPILADSGREFYVVISGQFMKELPDLPIICLPLINTSLHKLADATDPRWSFRVRHRGCWRSKTRPKVSIYPEGSRGMSISFLLRSRPLYHNLEAVMADLLSVSYTLKSRNLELGAIQTRVPDELEFLQQVNDARQARLERTLVPSCKHTVFDDNVVEFIAALPTRKLVAA